MMTKTTYKRKQMRKLAETLTALIEQSHPYIISLKLTDVVIQTSNHEPLLFIDNKLNLTAYETEYHSECHLEEIEQLRNWIEPVLDVFVDIQKAATYK